MSETSLNFEQIGLKDWLVRQCRGMGVKEPTLVQQKCIPAALKGKDVIGCSKTGSGKTLAFALPILQSLSEDPYGIFALVLTPTRELAFQIADQFRAVGKPLNLRDCVVIGGRDMVMQGKDLANKPHIVIATPGRLADHLESCNTFSLKKIKYLVLDEADRLVDGSFDGQLKTIFESLPASSERQTLYFSATLSDSLQQLRDLASSKGREPFVWQSHENDKSDIATVQGLDQRYVLTPSDAKDAYLAQVIRQHYEQKEREKDLTIIFTRTCRMCQLIAMTLTTLGFASSSLHSMMAQKERSLSLAKFRSSQVRILVATDVASRGLDIPDVQMVLNHNVPHVTKDYIHRVGRTARAGRRGMAITFVTPNDVVLIKAVEESIGIKLKEYENLDDEEVVKIHTQVGVTRREANAQLMETDFDERRNINRRKRWINEGKDPEVEEKRHKQAQQEKRKAIRKEQKLKNRLRKLNEAKSEKS